MGRNLINYPGDCGTHTANLLTVKLLLNSIISTPNAKFMSIDIKDFYLKTPMSRYEYFCMKLELFPEDIIEEYDLRNKVDANGNIHCKDRRGMYGLPQAESSRRNYSRDDFSQQATHNPKTHPATGSTSGTP